MVQQRNHAGDLWFTSSSAALDGRRGPIHAVRPMRQPEPGDRVFGNAGRFSVLCVHWAGVRPAPDPANPGDRPLVQLHSWASAEKQYIRWQAQAEPLTSSAPLCG